MADENCIDAKSIIEMIGVKNIASACRVGESAVSHWKARGIPAKHAFTIGRLAGMAVEKVVPALAMGTAE